MNARTGVALALLVTLAGCGGGGGGGGTGGNGGGGGGGGNPPTGTTITASFSNANGAPMPNVVATSSGTFTSWSVASLSGSTLQFTLPPGITSYGIAYYCQNHEAIFEASTTDTTKPLLGCSGATSTTNVTFSYDVHNISGATQAEIDVSNASFSASSGAQASVSGSYTFASPTILPGGPVDIMVKALDNSGNVLGLHITRAQTLTSGGTYGLTPLASTETTTLQALSASNVPSGWTPSYSGGIILGDGGRFALQAINGFYAVPPASQVQPSDYYVAEALASPANNSSTTAAVVTASAPPASVSLPAPFTYTGPTPADDPTFAFNYSGSFSLSGTILYQTTMQWNVNSLDVVATKGAVGGNPSIAIPKLSTISSLFPNLPSGGVNVSWNSYVIDETPLELGSITPANFSAQLTWAQGNYIAP